MEEKATTTSIINENRIQQDLEELQTESKKLKYFKVQIYEQHHPQLRLGLHVTITPYNGPWENRPHTFQFLIHDGYPTTPPNVTLLDNIFHPQFGEDGKIQLNILSNPKDWNSSFTLFDVVERIVELFKKPNCLECINWEAGEMLEKDPDQFEEMALAVAPPVVESLDTEVPMKLLITMNHLLSTGS